MIASPPYGGLFVKYLSIYFMKISAGILVYKKVMNELYVLLAHPGGPFWQKKDIGAWSIPKGEPSGNEDLMQTAIREFYEETEIKLDAPFIKLKPVKLKSGKLVTAYAKEADPDVTVFRSNFTEVEWPPRSGKKISIPEIDKLEWFNMDEAEIRINPAMVPILNEIRMIAL